MSPGRLPFDPMDEARKNWTAQGWGDVAEAMAAVTSVMRAQQIMLSRVEEVLRPLGLTFARFEALALLAFSRKGSLPLSKIGQRLQVHPASVTKTIDRLESDGFVRRVAHPTDRRTTLAEITPAGRERMTTAAAVLNTEVFGDIGLSGRDTTTLNRVLRAFRANAGDFGA
jgi:DNA-binding MarR family transcriptional regulator